MAKIICGILDADQDYIFKFVNYINQRDNLQIEAVGFNSIDMLLEYCVANHIDLLILPKEDIGIDNEHIRCKVILSEDKLVNGENLYIYKYQSMKNIVDEVIRFIPCESAERFLQTGGKKKQVIGVYSPIARCYKTSFSLMLAKEYSIDKKVLYVNLEEYSGIGTFMDVHFEYSLSDIMLIYLQEAKSVLLKQERMIKDRYNISLLPPIKCIRDVYELGIDKWKAYFELLVTGSAYDVIIIDFGNTAFYREELFELCDYIYMPDKRMKSNAKLEEFLKHMENIKDGRLKLKLKEIDIPYIAGLTDVKCFDEITGNMEFTNYVKEIVKWKN